MDTTHSTTPAASLALASLGTEALRQEAAALAAEIERETGREPGWCIREAVCTLGDLLSYAAEWDQEAVNA